MAAKSKKKISTRVLIVEARFYQDLADEMAQGAIATLQEHGVAYERLAVPGAFEVPGAIKLALTKYDGFIALGCVMRGETTHYDYVCGESARGLQDLAVHYDACVGYGILTTENEQQAWARARIGEGNKGRDAALACLRMIELKRRFGSRPSAKRRAR